MQPVLRTLRQHQAWDRVCLAAFDDRRLTALRREGDRRLLTSMGQRSVTALWIASRYGGWPLRSQVNGSAAQVPPLHGRLRVVDHRFVRLAHRWGLEVHPWTVDEAPEMHALLDLGVDGLVTDRPDVLQDVLSERGQAATSGKQNTERPPGNHMRGREPLWVHRAAATGACGR